MKNTDNAHYRKTISKWSYIPAILAFIPLIGIPFGLSAILWGISDWKIGGKKTVIVAEIGILLTILVGWYLSTVVSSTFNTYLKSPQSSEVKLSMRRFRWVSYYGTSNTINLVMVIIQVRWKSLKKAILNSKKHPSPTFLLLPGFSRWATRWNSSIFMKYRKMEMLIIYSRLGLIKPHILKMIFTRSYWMITNLF